MIFPVFLSNCLVYATSFSEYCVQKVVLDIHMLVLCQGRFENLSIYFLFLRYFHMGLDFIVFYQDLIVQMV